MENRLLNRREKLREEDLNNERDTSIETLTSKIEAELKNVLTTVGNSDKKRTDAHITSICRFCKKFHRFWVYHLDSKFCHKSHKVSKFLPEWLKSFKKCVLPLLNMGSIDKDKELELFLHSIVITFPEKRVIKILDLFRKKSSKDYKLLVSHMKKKKKTSLKSAKILYSENLFFKAIVDRFMSLVPHIDNGKDLKEIADGVISKIQGRQPCKLSTPFH